MSRRSMHFARVPAVLMAFLVLASCATLNEDQCRTADWSQLGREDGAAGRASSHLERHRKACSGHGLPVDDRQWTTGWKQGIRAYCTPESGLRNGREGRHYANSCPADLEDGFERAYSVGRAVHDARATRERLRNDIDELEFRIYRSQAPGDRRRIRMEISSLYSELRFAEFRLHDAEREYDRYARSNGLTGR